MGVATNERTHEVELCAVLNLAYKVDGAEAEMSADRYTGRLLLSGQAASHVAGELERLEHVEARVVYLSRELYGSHAHVEDPASRPGFWPAAAGA